MRKWLLMLCALLITIVGGTLLLSQSKESESQTEKLPNVAVQFSNRKTLYRTLTVPGDIVANQEATLYARVGGYLETLNVDRGTWVKKDDVLAIISVPELTKQLEKEKADLTWKESRYNRTQKLVIESPDLFPQDVADELKGLYETAKAELEKTKELINFATIKAPFDGIVTDRWVYHGDLVQSGTTKILHIMDAQTVRIRIHIAEPDAPFILEKSKVTMTIDELPDKKWEAKISRFSWALNRNTKTMTVEIDVKNDNLEIRPGMFARITVNLDAHENALTLPASALIMERGKTFVFVVHDGVVSKAPIKIGIDNGIEVEILEGITDKDEVITTGKNLVSDGEKVRTTRK